jgi:glucose-6-phosphate isomerase
MREDRSVMMVTNKMPLKWRVEWGKVLAQRMIPELEGKEEPSLAHDSSTNNLIRSYRKPKELS